MRPIALPVLLALSTSVLAQAPATSLELRFTASAETFRAATKRGTLVHELGHRLAADVPFKGDHHELIFLFVYDVWVDLWGQSFADGQVKIESQRKGVSDYEGIWKRTLALPAAERAKRFQEIVVGGRPQ